CGTSGFPPWSALRRLFRARLAGIDPRDLLEMGEWDSIAALLAAGVGPGADGLQTPVDEGHEAAQPLDRGRSRLAATEQLLDVHLLSIEQVRELLVDLGALLEELFLEDLDLAGSRGRDHSAQSISRQCAPVERSERLLRAIRQA